MTPRDERPDLRDVDPIAPAPDPGPEEQDTVSDVDEVGIAAAAGSGGMPAVGVLAEPTVVDPATLDPERDDVDRNAAGGGWEGANKVIENDFEAEQLRQREARET